MLALLAQQAVPTFTIVAAGATVGAVLGGIQFVMKLIDWRRQDRGPQPTQCALQHGTLLQDTRATVKALEKLADSQADLNAAIGRMADAISTEERISEMRHKEIMRGFELLEAHLRTFNHPAPRPPGPGGAK